MTYQLSISDLETIKNHRGPCGPVALSIISNVELPQMVNICRNYGYKGSGMYLHSLEAVMKYLQNLGVIRLTESFHYGREYKAVGCGLVSHRCHWSPEPVLLQRGTQCEYCGRYVSGKAWKSTGPSLTRFCAEHRTGRYVCFINGHFMTVIDGEVVDPLMFKRGGTKTDKRKVQSYWKVEVL